jgi:hypothetical protein
VTRSRYERNGEMGQIYTDARTGKKYTESYDGKPPSVASGGAVTAAAAATSTVATGTDAQCPASFHTIRGYGLMNATTTIGGHPRSATTSEQCVIIAPRPKTPFRPLSPTPFRPLSPTPFRPCVPTSMHVHAPVAVHRCCAMCVSTTGCVAWTVHPQAGQCWLTAHPVAPHAASGVRRPLRPCGGCFG